MVLRVRFHSTKLQGFQGTGVTPCGVKPNRCPPCGKVASLFAIAKRGQGVDDDKILLTSSMYFLRLCLRMPRSPASGTDLRRIPDFKKQKLGGRPQEPTPAHGAEFLPLYPDYGDIAKTTGSPAGRPVPVRLP